MPLSLPLKIPRSNGCVEDCRGCAHRDFSAEESHRQKEAWVRRFFPQAKSIMASPLRWQYREKVLLHAQYTAGWQFGFLSKKNWKEFLFIPIPDCPIHSPFVNQVFASLSQHLPSEIPLRFVLVSGKAVTLVMKEKPNAANRAKLLSVAEALVSIGVKALWANWNPSCGRRVLAVKQMDLLYGDEFIQEADCWHGATGFRQVLPDMEELAQTLAENFFAGEEIRAVVDFYSGIGLSLRRWKRNGWSTVGVELSGEAVKAAQKNAPGIPVWIGRVEERLPQITVAEPFALYTNPPRTGQHEAVNEWITMHKPQAIAYLSCNVKTLERDLKALKNYELVSIQPLDFFPQTDHCEVLALLRKTM